MVNESRLDFVITWVDGNEPAYKAKLRPYLSPEAAARQDVAGDTRFLQCGELFACVGSILKFAADVVRRIIIVTYQQDPHIHAWVKEHFPGNEIPILIVDHAEIFKGYEQYLPVFNSISIETMLWRIPGLTENFVYMNDDCMLVRYVEYGDFVRPDGAVVAHCTPFPAWLVDVIKIFNGGKLTHKATMYHAAHILHRRCFEKIYHTPQTLNKNWFEENFAKAGLTRNLRHRFRHEEQVNIQSLFYTATVNSRTAPRSVRVSAKGKVVFLHCGSRKKDYLVRHLERIDKTPTVKYACFNDVPLLAEEDLKGWQDWVKKVLFD